MDASKFVDLVRTQVMEAAVKQVTSTLLAPPGRRPDAEVLALSTWYLGLAKEDQEMVGRALAEASHAAVFGVLAVLDGVARIDPAEPPGELELWYAGEGGRARLDGDLHDFLNSEPWHK
jgi:hypothetical protein